MDELTLTFARARFGDTLAKQAAVKEAINPAFMEQVQQLANLPELDANKKKLRNMIEQSIRSEQQKREEAKELISHGKKRLTDPGRMGGAGTLALDALRSLIPGLSISAAADSCIEKAAKEPAEKLPGRAFDIAHALAAAGGAGTGYAAQKGLFGGVYGRDVAERLAGGTDALRSQMLNVLLGAGGKESHGRASDQVRSVLERAARTHDIGLAAQPDTPVINRITRLFAPSTWRNLVSRTPADPTATEARNAMIDAVRRGLSGSEQTEALGVLGRMQKALGSVIGAAKSNPERAAFSPGGWKGALLGAALVSAPFAIHRMLKTRSLRRRGGTAAEAAAEKAERLLSEAGTLQSERKKLLQR